MMKFVAKCLFVALLATAGLSAQGVGSVQIRILTFGKITGPRELFLAKPGKKGNWSEVKLHLNNFTGPYKASGRTLAFYDLSSGSDGANSPVAKTIVPASLGSRVLLVFIPLENPMGNYLIMPVSDDVRSFRPGERKFVNLTPYLLAGQIDRRKFKIMPQSTGALSPQSPPDGKDVHEVTFYFQKKEQWLPLTSTIWPHDPESRSLIFFWWQSKIQRIRIQSIEEYMKKAG